MGQFRNWLNEARDKSVPTEYRIALGQLKRMYNPGEVPSEKELEKDVEIIAKKNHLDAEKFLEFAKAQFKMNESEKMINLIKKLLPTGDLHIGKIGKNKEYVWTFGDGSHIRITSDGDDRVEYYAKGGDYITTFTTIKQIEKYLNQAGLLNESKITKSDSGKYTLVDGVIQITKKELAKIHKDYKSDNTILTMIGGVTTAVPFTINEAKELNVGDIVILDVNSIENSEYVNQFPGKKVPKSVKIISPKINVNGDFTFEVPKYRGKEAILPKKFIMESAVGTPGRTTIKDAEDHINDELIAEFKKIIKKLGGKTVAKVLLDKLGQKPEIKDEIEHIEDMIDNSNY